MFVNQKKKGTGNLYAAECCSKVIKQPTNLQVPILLTLFRSRRCGHPKEKILRVELATSSHKFVCNQQNKETKFIHF